MTDFERRSHSDDVSNDKVGHTNVGAYHGEEKLVWFAASIQLADRYPEPFLVDVAPAVVADHAADVGDVSYDGDEADEPGFVKYRPDEVDIGKVSCALPRIISY
jgi:hypothetical protein